MRLQCSTSEQGGKIATRMGTAAKKGTLAAFRHFAGTDVLQQFYNDNAAGLKSPASELDWAHPTSTPFMPKRNGKIERWL